MKSYATKVNYCLKQQFPDLKIEALKNVAEIHMKTPVLESLFNKFAGLKVYNFTKKRLQHRCFLSILGNFNAFFTPSVPTSVLSQSSPS